MGNKPVEKKRKKKGRPSLLDLQKRSLRLQRQQQQQNPNPSPNPYLRFPPRGPITRRNPNSDPDENDEDDDDDEDGDQRREKKLKLVLRIPNGSADSPAGPSDYGSSGDDADRDEGEKRDSSKGTDSLRGDPSDSGPTTPLPDKKLLVFILDRLQKKDTYGVFSEPVDPKELPDYHKVIKHPMDFGTLRKKLSNGVYANLEQFEKDVFLISSNAMRYNAHDTIYYRQARSIQELAKKDFENLRQESEDDDEVERKAVRRGRPASKNGVKPIGGVPPAERTASDFSSDATLANASENTHWSSLNHDLLRKGSSALVPGASGVSTRASLGVRSSSWMVEPKAEKNEEYSGSALRGILTRYGKKPLVIDENRRNTYKQPHPLATCMQKTPFLTYVDGQKQLLPVGVHMAHAYARSVARFAANLGPVGWSIAARKIERALPPGTKFGRGWVGDGDAPPPSTSTVSRSEQVRPEPPSDELAVVEQGKGSTSFEAKAQVRPNGVSTPFAFNLASQLGKMAAPMTHARALDMVSRGSAGFVQLDPEGCLRGLKPDPVPPDLNVGFQSPASPVSGVMVVDSQQPDLALQL